MALSEFNQRVLRNKFENINSQNNLSFIGYWNFFLIGCKKIFRFWNPWSWIIFNVNHSEILLSQAIKDNGWESGAANILTDSVSQETNTRFTKSDKHINVISCKIIEILILQLNMSNRMRFHSRKINRSMEWLFKSPKD